MRLEEYVQKYGWQVKEGYGNYVLERIAVGERTNLKAMMGMNDKWEMEVIPVLPLNGWRARNLAEVVFGKRDAGVWEIGVSKLVRVQDLLNLPDWDGANERYLKEFHTREHAVVAIEVVIDDPGYGAYIHITPLAAPSPGAYYPEQANVMDERDMALVEESHKAHSEAHAKSLKDVLEGMSI